MTKIDALQKVILGEVLCFGEYRLFEASDASWRDKKDGTRKSGVVQKHVVEFGSLSVDISEFAPDGVKVADCKQPFAKGSSVVFFPSAWNTTKGSVSARGRLESLTGDVPLLGAKAVASGARS